MIFLVLTIAVLLIFYGYHRLDKRRSRYAMKWGGSE